MLLDVPTGLAQSGEALTIVNCPNHPRLPSMLPRPWSSSTCLLFSSCDDRLPPSPPFFGPSSRSGCKAAQKLNIVVPLQRCDAARGTMDGSSTDWYRVLAVAFFTSSLVPGSIADCTGGRKLPAIGQKPFPTQPPGRPTANCQRRPVEDAALPSESRRRRHGRVRASAGNRVGHVVLAPKVRHEWSLSRLDLAGRMWARWANVT